MMLRCAGKTASAGWLARPRRLRKVAGGRGVVPRAAAAEVREAEASQEDDLFSPRKAEQRVVCRTIQLQIRQARNPEELLRLVKARGESFDYLNATLAVHRLGTFVTSTNGNVNSDKAEAIRGTSGFKAMARLIQRNEAKLDPRLLQVRATAYGRLGFKSGAKHARRQERHMRVAMEMNERMLESESIEEVLSLFSSEELTVAGDPPLFLGVTALHRLKKHSVEAAEAEKRALLSDARFATLAAVVEANIEHMPPAAGPKALNVVLDSFTSLGYPLSPAFLDAVAARMLALVRRASMHDIELSLFRFAGLKHDLRVSVLKSLLEEAGKKLEEAEPQNIGRLMAALAFFAEAYQPEPELLNAIDARVEEDLEAYSVLAAAQVLDAWARLGRRPHKRLLRSVARQCSYALNHAPPQHQLQLLRAIGKLETVHATGKAAGDDDESAGRGEGEATAGGGGGGGGAEARAAEGSMIVGDARLVQSIEQAVLRSEARLSAASAVQLLEAFKVCKLLPSREPLHSLLRVVVAESKPLPAARSLVRALEALSEMGFSVRDESLKPLTAKLKAVLGAPAVQAAADGKLRLRPRLEALRVSSALLEALPKLEPEAKAPIPN
mmetsp:Transcript_1215/g.4512  ORF Transcript_1215/g.4512 Transcript_1215/m.4512 type:complete len:611 (-) Transcript_1215:52-1884(-)